MTAVTGKHFLDAVSEYGGCPMLLRTDNGAENVLMSECKLISAISAILEKMIGQDVRHIGMVPHLPTKG